MISVFVVKFLIFCRAHSVQLAWYSKVFELIAYFTSFEMFGYISNILEVLSVL